MRRHVPVLFAIVLLVLLLGLLPAACSGAKDETAVPATEQESPAVTLDAASLLEERCTRCHDLGRVEQAAKTAAEWEETVKRMVGKGAVLSQAEQELIIQYLAETYPK